MEIPSKNSEGTGHVRIQDSLLEQGTWCNIPALTEWWLYLLWLEAEGLCSVRLLWLFALKKYQRL